MVKPSAAQKAQFMLDLKEDLAEFRASHRVESKGQKWKFVPARMITLPGLVLHTLEQFGMIESDGAYNYRPK